MIKNFLLEEALVELKKFTNPEKESSVLVEVSSTDGIKWRVWGFFGDKGDWSFGQATFEAALANWKVKVSYNNIDESLETKFISNE